MKEDLSVPKEFEEYSKSLYAKGAISAREYIDFCLLATQLIDTNWDKRQGIAYHLAGALQYKSISEDALLSEIGEKFARLELPDHHVGDNEKAVRLQWEQVKELVTEADKKF